MTKYTQVFEKPIVITPLAQARITGWNCALIASFLNRSGWTPDGQLFSEAAASLLELLNRHDKETIAQCPRCNRHLTAGEVGQYYVTGQMFFGCGCGATFSMVVEIGKDETPLDK